MTAFCFGDSIFYTSLRGNHSDNFYISIYLSLEAKHKRWELSVQGESEPPSCLTRYQMNYLKSITTSVLNSTGVTFPFSIGERIPGLDTHASIWDIREGVKKVSLAILVDYVADCE